MVVKGLWENELKMILLDKKETIFKQLGGRVFLAKGIRCEKVLGKELF